MTGLVTAVLCAAFDDATDTAVLAVRDLVTRAGVRLPARPRHRPHVTLAGVRVHPDQLDRVTDLARAAVRGHAPVRVTFGRVGSFARTGALWLGPDDPADLRTPQRSVHDAVAAGPFDPVFGARSEPATWVPHCSLATRLDRATLTVVERAVVAALRPVEAVVAGVAVVLVGGSGDVGLVPLGDGQPSAWPTAAAK